MDDILKNINTSKLLAGTAILLTNIGSKYRFRVGKKDKNVPETNS